MFLFVLPRPPAPPPLLLRAQFVAASLQGSSPATWELRHHGAMSQPASPALSECHGRRRLAARVVHAPRLLLLLCRCCCCCCCCCSCLRPCNVARTSDTACTGQSTLGIDAMAQSIYELPRTIMPRSLTIGSGDGPHCPQWRLLWHRIWQRLCLRWWWWL